MYRPGSRWIGSTAVSTRGRFQFRSATVTRTSVIPVTPVAGPAVNALPRRQPALSRPIVWWERLPATTHRATMGQRPPRAGTTDPSASRSRPARRRPCSKRHSESCGRRIGTFVERMAAVMSMRSGIVASRVSSPTTSIAPHAVSITLTKGAIASGTGMPMRAKRPAPMTPGKRNFWTPSSRNTSPTRRRMRITALGARILA
jgi:hypothetical protein